MYCPNCKIKFEGSGNYCPLCGGRLSADEHNYGYIVDDSVISDSFAYMCPYPLTRPPTRSTFPPSTTSIPVGLT